MYVIVTNKSPLTQTVASFTFSIHTFEKDSTQKEEQHQLLATEMSIYAFFSQSFEK